MSNATDAQKQLLDAMHAVAQQEVSRASAPKIEVGTVVQDPAGYDCIVNIQGTEKKCILPEHLHDWIGDGDIVFVTDVQGNGANLVVTGSSGTARKSQSLVINDEDKHKLVGGVTKFEDDNGNLTDNDLTVQ